MADLVQSLDVNTLPDVHTIEEFIQLSVGSDVEIIANVGFVFGILSRLLNRCFIGSMLLCHKKEARGGWSTCRIENLDKNSQDRMHIERSMPTGTEKGINNQEVVELK